jgi:hypothetical protein
MSDVVITRRTAPLGKWSVAGFAGLLSVPLFFALYTGQIWEDFFITYRHSQNLIMGQGLVYSAGERVHGFTSPVGVLLPALCDLLTGQRSYLHALWLFRILSAVAFAVGGLLIWRVLSDDESPYARWFGVLLYSFDAKGVANTVNGMETAFMLVLVAWHVNLLRKPLGRHWIAVGLCWAGLMWVRPDGCIYIAALSLAGLLFGQGPRKETLIGLFKSALVCTLLYLPWFIWAWAYYGSPIPNTVLAKMNVEHAATDHLGHALLNPVQRFVLAAGDVFRPAYSGPDTSWHWGIWVMTTILGGFCACYWAAPGRDRLGRAVSLTFALLCVYFSSMPMVYPWYYPPVAVLGVVVLSRGAFAMSRALTRWPRTAARIAFAVLALLLVERAYLFAQTCRQAAFAQECVEMGNRARIGLWLREQIAAGAGNTVYLEPIGYVGYFSGARILDWPGLVTPEVVRLRAEEHLDFYAVPAVLRPDWIVLRPHEASEMMGQPFFKEHYTLEKVFDVSPEIKQATALPGRVNLMFDAVFLVYKRTDADGRPGTAETKSGT